MKPKTAKGQQAKQQRASKKQDEDISSDSDSEDKDTKSKEEGSDDLNIYPIDYDDSKLNQGEAKYPLSSPVHFHIIIGSVIK